MSLRIGHVGFSTRFFCDGALTDERFHRAIVAARLCEALDATCEDL